MGKFVKKKVVAFLDLSSAYHIRDRNQWWINSQEFKSNSQNLHFNTTVSVDENSLPSKEISFCSRDRATAAGLGIACYRHPSRC